MLPNGKTRRHLEPSKHLPTKMHALHYKKLRFWLEDAIEHQRLYQDTKRKQVNYNLKKANMRI